MDLYRSLVRPLAFKLDPETVHEFAITLASKGLIKEHGHVDYGGMEQILFGARFRHPLGLAAGFDKNAVALSHWSAAGFSFAEMGTVTFHPQPGNPRPRLFRLPDDKALVNRLGFNNAGAAILARNISRAKTEMPFGINFGKSMVTALESAAEDYRQSYSLLHTFGNYAVVNVSSPNTPGLRSLQDKEKLKEIIAAMQSVDRVKPLFVKVAPDLDLPALDEVAEVAHEMGLTGLIATNTTIQRVGLRTATTEAGGLSGAPVKGMANAVLAHLYKVCDKSKILIGVGGIFTGDDLYEKIALGAHLCQVYTGWVYGGPNMVPETLERFSDLMKERGFKTVEDLRGSGAGA